MCRRPAAPLARLHQGSHVVLFRLVDRQLVHVQQGRGEAPHQGAHQPDGIDAEMLVEEGLA